MDKKVRDLINKVSKTLDPLDALELYYHLARWAPTEKRKVYLVKHTWDSFDAEGSSTTPHLSKMGAWSFSYKRVGRRISRY